MAGESRSVDDEATSRRLQEPRQFLHGHPSKLDATFRPRASETATCARIWRARRGAECSPRDDWDTRAINRAATPLRTDSSITPRHHQCVERKLACLGCT